MLDKQAVEIPPTIPNILEDVEVETLFFVRISPLENGDVASDMISSAGGLGEGTPKVCIEIIFCFKEMSGIYLYPLYLFGFDIHL